MTGLFYLALGVSIVACLFLWLKLQKEDRRNRVTQQWLRDRTYNRTGY